MLVRLGRECLRGALIAALVASTGCFGGTPDGGDGDGAGECELDSDDEKTPGYPFDLSVFDAEVLPLLKADCALCHAEGGANVADYAMFAGADPETGNCDYAKTFNNFKAKTNTTTPANSPILFVLTASLTHPTKYAAGSEAKLAVFNDFITNANLTCVADNGCQEAADGSFFDQDVYENQIQPIINTADGKGCAISGCHLGTDDGTGVATGGQGPGTGFSLFPNPALGSAEIEANFVTVQGRMNLDNVLQSNLYLQATTRHGANMSAKVSEAEAATILDWIEAAKAVKDSIDPGEEPVVCSDVTKLNAEVFRDEILPMLDGEIDYNDLAGGGGNATGCTRVACHGQDRGPSTFSLPPTASLEEKLENFACFIDLVSPSRSQVLLCPTDDPGCIRNPHPGGDILDGADDLNYQKLLSFMFASVADATPVDFAFFARRINPIFDDENASAAIDNTTCADTAGCHGVSVAGQQPPNGSNFGILPNAGEGALRINFGAARNFINFIDAAQSSLFLYPTNEIANVDNPFATGIGHGGGEAFAVDSVFADDVLLWATGLRPDADGFLNNWLIAGDFASTDPDDEPIANQDDITPQIFDDGGNVLGGIFEGLFEIQNQVDVGAALDASGGNVGGGRIAYAVAYLLNTTGRTLDDVVLTIETQNEVEVQAGDGLGLSPQGGGNATVVFDIPAFSETQTSTRVLIKIFEAVDDGGMVFSALLEDENGNAIDDAGDIIMRLDALGGF